MIEYVLGFAFIGTEVILIQKTKPEFQKGKLNGVGGKIEVNESPASAMVREFEEETSVKTHPGSWVLFAVMRFYEAKVHCFTSALPGFNAAIRTTTEEKISRVKTYDVICESLPNAMENICYLTLMARAAIRGAKDVIYLSVE